MFARNFRTAAVLGALLLLAMVTLAGCSSSSSSGGASGSTAGSADTAPEFSGATLDGMQVSLGDYLGKPVVLAFMASW
jgi:cytochrome oxidase Cu insertion factor (SCO1/SenC/PrrC family)